MTSLEAPRELVLASAGSGKTFRISSRLIGLLALGVSADEIMASSFTRKAAGQILDRVLARMAAAVLDPGAAAALGVFATIDDRRPAPSTCAGWAAVLERTARDLHRLNVGTLDAFLMGAAASFEAELGLPMGWRIAEEAERRRVISRAVGRMLETHERDSLLRMLRDSARGTPRRAVHESLVRSIRGWLEIDEALEEGEPDPWTAFRRLGPIVAFDDAERIRVARELEELLFQPDVAPGTQIVKAVGTVADRLRLKQWEKLFESKLVQNSADADPKYGRQPIPPRIVAMILGEVVPLALASLRAELAEYVEARGALTRLFRDEYRRLQAETGAYSFGDITRLVGSGGADPLGSRTDLYYRLDGLVRHVLLDEFQDTARAQWEALEPLIDEVLSDDGRAAVIVADPKQSIYGWRGAETGLVHAVGARYALKEDHLAVSFRSSQRVLDFVNRVFENIAEHPQLHGIPGRGAIAATWAADFHEHRAHQDLPGYAVLEYGPEEAEPSRPGRRPRLLKHAAERIRRLREEAPGFSIGVLTRTNEAVARLYLELRALGVPASQHGGNPLTDSAACEAVLALVRFADHPDDTISAYLVARSPVGRVVGFTEWTDPQTRARFAREFRRRLIDEGYGSTLGAIAMAIAPVCDLREARRLGQLTDLAHRYDSAATLRPADFVRAAEAERVEDPSATNVRIMTVHQAKGLEFDIVVLPELSRRIESHRSLGVLPLRLDNGHEQGAFADGGPTGVGERVFRRPNAVMPTGSELIRGLFPEMREAWLQQRTSEWRDELSGLYVALTRARYATYAIVAPSAAGAGEKAVTAGSLICSALRIAVDPAGVAGDAAYAIGSPDWHRDPAVEPEGAVAEPGIPPRPIRIRIDSGGRAYRRFSPSDLHRREAVDIRNLLQIDTVAAMERGTLIHAWFERVGWVDSAIPGDDELRGIAGRVAPAMTAAEVDAVLSEFRSWTSVGPIADALRSSRYGDDATIETEVPFVVRRDDGLMEGVIDRLVSIRRNGQVVAAEILDFKTGKPRTDRVGDRIDEYRSQMEAYRHAVAAMFALPPERCTAVLLFVEMGLVVRLGEGSEEAGPDPAGPVPA